MLKVLLEDVAKMFVQRHRPAETLADVILRGMAAAHGLSFPSGHAMVIFAIPVLASPYFKGWWKVRSRLLCRAGEAWPGALPLRRLTGTAIRSGRPRQHRRIRPGRPRTVLRCAG
jgi:membrane-associated phospholipid phosphatase